MRRLFFISIIGILLITVVSTDLVAANDKPSTWSYNTIQEMLSYKDFRGNAFQEYQSDITRKDFIYMAVRVYEIATNREVVVDDGITFKDTSDTYALKAAMIGITNGVGNNLFAPNQTLTREQLAVFMIRTMKLADIELATVTDYAFMDEDDFSSWAKESIYLAKANNIVNGIGGDRFNPLGNATVEQALVISDRIIKKSGIVQEKSTFELLKLPKQDDRYDVYYFDDNPDEGYHWGGYLLIPNDLSSNNMIVTMNMPHSRGDTYEEMKDYAIDTILSSRKYALETNSMLFVPVFPRFNENKETRAKDGSMVYMSEYSLTTDKTAYRDADIQLNRMIDEIRSHFAFEGFEIERESVFIGYSMSGIFASRYALLQPSYVKCVVVGGHGWSILATDSYNGIDLNYPFGIADIGVGKPINRELDLIKFHELPLLYYIGEDDKNGFSYNPDEFDGIMNDFTPAEFIRVADEEYSKYNPNARFALVESGNHGSSEGLMYDQIIEFISDNIE